MHLRCSLLRFSAFFPPTGSQESLLCPVRALKAYIERSASYRNSEQLFVGIGNRAKGGPVTKQRISRWLVDAITIAYSSSGLQCPIGGIASSWAWSSEVSISDICEVAGLVLASTFVRFYNLDVPALQARALSAQVAIFRVHLTNIVQAFLFLGLSITIWTPGVILEWQPGHGWPSRSESCYRWTTPQAASLLCLSPPCLALGAEESVFWLPLRQRTK